MAGFCVVCGRVPITQIPHALCPDHASEFYAGLVFYGSHADLLPTRPITLADYIVRDEALRQMARDLAGRSDARTRPCRKCGRPVMLHETRTGRLSERTLCDDCLSATMRTSARGRRRP